MLFKKLLVLSFLISFSTTFILCLSLFQTDTLELSFPNPDNNVNDFGLYNPGNTNITLPKSSAPLTPKNAYAIVVGISDYPGTDNDLSYCDDDAQDVYSMLINDYNFKPENIIYLQDSSATLNGISNAFDTIASQISDDDIFFFYYSGHGGAELVSSGSTSWVAETPHNYPNYYDRTWSVARSGAQYMRVHFYRLTCEYGYDFLLCGDSDVNHGYYYELYSGDYGYNFWSAYLPVNRYYLRFVSDVSITYYGFKVDMYEALLPGNTHYLCSYDSIPSTPSNYYLDTLLDSKLDSLNCEEKYVVLDSCNSGGMIPEVQDIGRYIMTACQADEFSMESPSLSHGVFTNFFLQSYDSASDANSDGVKSMQECYSYTYANTVSYSGSMGYTHHPQQYNGIAGEAVLATSFGSISLNPTGNSLSYTFDLYGTGLIQELYLALCHVSSDVNYTTEDLTLIAPTSTGFGSYSGTVQFDGVSNITGYGLFARIEGNRVIYLNTSVSEDYDEDSLEDLDEIIMGLNPLLADSDSDGLNDNIEFYGVTDPLNNDTDGDGMLDGYEVNFGLDPLTDDSTGDYDGDGLTNLLEFQLGTYANNSDTDSDGLFDGSEVSIYFTDPTDEDTDDDGLSDGLEILTYNTDPLNGDTDGDGMSDGFEISFGFNNVIDDSFLDNDNDGLSNLLEYQHNSNPLIPDTDGDGINDGLEVLVYTTNPNNQDTDGDGMDDSFEITYDLNPLTDDSNLDIDNDGLTNIIEYEFGTCPLLCDSDGDFMTDCYEYDCNLNPTVDDAELDYDNDGLSNLLEFLLNSLANDQDTDNDNMPDGWEYTNDLNPTSYDSNLDNDGDGLTNYQEYLQQTDPNQADTDADGLYDGDEVEIHHTDPLNPDSDGDGFIDGIEIAWGSDPLNAKNSLYNIFFNIVGIAFLISSGYFFTRTTLVSKKQAKKALSEKPKLSIDKTNIFNSVKVERKEKPKPVRPVYKPRPYTPAYTQTRPPYFQQKSLAHLSSSEINELRNTILYRLPSPKSPFSQEGKLAMSIANLAMDDIKRGDMFNFSKRLVQSLMMGVPEPMNRTLKTMLLEVLDKLSPRTSRIPIPPSSTTSPPQQYTKEASQLSPDIKYCGYCGKQNKATNKFCANCGRAF